jgi:hypothetical protein
LVARIGHPKQTLRQIGQVRERQRPDAGLGMADEGAEG